MVFESIKLLRIVNKANLMLEELFLLQTIHDYSIFQSELKMNEIKELSDGYLLYFKQFGQKYDEGGSFECANPWRNIIDKLLRDGWLIDNRKNKGILRLSEFEVSDKFLEMFKGSKTDEELYEIAKKIYPKVYKAFANAQTITSFSMTPSADNVLFGVFKKKILGGNRIENWNRFLVITQEMFEDPENQYGSMSFEKYINSFNDSLSTYQKMIEA